MIKRLKNFGITNPIKEVISSDPSQTYLLYRKGDKVRCTCIGNSVHGRCKHVDRYIEESKDVS